MRDVLLGVDLLADLDHEDGARLADSLRARSEGVTAAFAEARRTRLPIVYANDDGGRWDGDGRGVVERALAGPVGDLVASIRPRAQDYLILKPRYSAFVGTPLELLLHELGAERILLCGAATEMCVAQTAISAREHGFKVTVLASACACIDGDDERLALDYLDRIVGCQIEPGWPAPREP